MKKALIIMFLIAFLIVPVFGFAVMNHEGGHSDCVAATANGINCPAVIGAFDMAIFHLESSRFFSLAVFNNNILSSILALAVLMLLIWLIALNDLYSIKQYAIYRHSRLFEVKPAQFKEKILRWFSLHENSPATP